MTAIFKPKSRMTFETVMSDKEALRLFLSQLQDQTWIFDLSQVKTCDSAGIALLVEAKRLSQSLTLSCQFEGVSPMMQALMLFLGVNFLIETVQHG